MAYMSKKTVKTFNDLDVWLKKSRKIRFKETRDEMEDTSILNLFNRICDKPTNQTFYVRGKEQCEAYRARSLYDFFRLVKYYNPEITSKEILIELIRVYKKFKFEGKCCKLLSYCPDIRKYNFRIYAYADSYYLKQHVCNGIKSDLQIVFPNLNKEDIIQFVDNKLTQVKYIPKEEQ